MPQGGARGKNSSFIREHKKRGYIDPAHIQLTVGDAQVS